MILLVSKRRIVLKAWKHEKTDIMSRYQKPQVAGEKVSVSIRTVWHHVTECGMLTNIMGTNDMQSRDRVIQITCSSKLSALKKARVQDDTV